MTRQHIAYFYFVKLDFGFDFDLGYVIINLFILNIVFGSFLLVIVAHCLLHNYSLMT